MSASSAQIRNTLHTRVFHRLCQRGVTQTCRSLPELAARLTACQERTDLLACMHAASTPRTTYRVAYASLSKRAVLRRSRNGRLCRFRQPELRESAEPIEKRVTVHRELRPADLHPLESDYL